MPFLSPDGTPQTTVDLRQVGPKTFQLLTGFQYRDPRSGTPYEVPRHDIHRPARGGNATDLASVPPVLWGLIASYGLHTRAALLHDKLSEDAHCLHRTAGAGVAFRKRRQADQLFRRALFESDVTWLRCWLLWTAVSVGAYFSHARIRAVFLSIALVSGISLLYLAPFLFAGNQLALALALPALVSALWPRDAGVLLLGTYAGAIVAPVFVLTWLTAIALWLLGFIPWLLFQRTRATRPVPAPYRLQRKSF